MTKYWVVYSNKFDEDGNLAPELVSTREDEDGMSKRIVAAKGASNEQTLLMAPADGDGDYVTIQQFSNNGTIELDLIYNEAAHDTACLTEIRTTRDKRLAECDWAAMPDVPMGSVTKAAWETYRQALRDVPQTPGIDPKDEETYSWPIKPA